MARKNLSAKQVSAADRLLERAFPDARQASRRSVLRHALTLFNAHGVEATTIDDLRRACGHSVGTIYHHFKNKEGLVAALFFVALDDQSRALAEHLEGLTEGQAAIEALLECYTAWITAQPECAHFVFLARDSVAQGPHAADLIPALVLGAAEFYARGWLAGRRQATPASHAQRFAAAAWRSLTA